MDHTKVFQMPKPVSISGRSSSITHSFVNSIIPVIQPTDAEILEALQILEMDPSDVRCAYCGDLSTEWDHLRPLVVTQRPTGYISEIGNLVPACGKCNQSKRNKYWRDWILSDAPRSPKSRGIEDLGARIKRLEVYEQWKPRDTIDFESIVGAELWAEHWRNWEAVLTALKTSQDLAERIRDAIRTEYEA